MHKLDEHAAEIERLKSMDPEVILSLKVKALVQAVIKNEITIEDVIQYTSITESQMKEWIEQYHDLVQE